MFTIMQHVAVIQKNTLNIFHNKSHQKSHIVSNFTKKLFKKHICDYDAMFVLNERFKNLLFHRLALLYLLFKKRFKIGKHLARTFYYE